MQMTYIATIRNHSTKDTRAITIHGVDPMKAHKKALWEHTTNEEDILAMRDDQGKVVFDINKGFK